MYIIKNAKNSLGFLTIGGAKIMNKKYLLAGILIIIPTVILAIVPLYNHSKPAFSGLPFFYWFQTLWLIIATVLYVLASLLISQVKGGDK